MDLGAGLTFLDSKFDNLEVVFKDFGFFRFGERRETVIGVHRKTRPNGAPLGLVFQVQNCARGALEN